MALAEDVAPVAASNNSEHSYVDWPAIFAGTVLASAISFVLLTFGSAIGLSMTSAYEGRGMTLFWFAIAAALWVLWVQISSFMAGGYLTGRMRRRHHDATEHESDIRDGSHGLVMWAVGVLLGAFDRVHRRIGRRFDRDRRGKHGRRRCGCGCCRQVPTTCSATAAACSSIVCFARRTRPPPDRTADDTR